MIRPWITRESRASGRSFVARAIIGCSAVAFLSSLPESAAGKGERDQLKSWQTEYVANAGQKAPRAYHFGSQGPGDVYSNHTSHTNRLIPVYTFGRKINLGAVTGTNSRYRDAQRIKELYGVVPEFTVNPGATYADQSDLYRVQKQAVAQGVKHLFIVWFDGMDWQTTQAAALVRTGRVYEQGKGAGLIFQDYVASGTADYGYVVTSPTHDQNRFNVDSQSVMIPPTSLGGGYNARIGGPSPWELGPSGAKAPGYFKGQSANLADLAGVKAAGGVLHAYTDSSQSAAEFVSGVKSYNNGVNVTHENRLVTTLFHDLQERGWKVGTVTSVPFNHVSPAAMYAQNVHRDDYQDLARAMLGLPGIMQQSRHEPVRPGLDVVLGTGSGIATSAKSMALQGSNGVPGNLYITDADLAAIDVQNGGKYDVVCTKAGSSGGQTLLEVAAGAAKRHGRLFGMFGREGLDHLPYRTADGGYDPAPSLTSAGETRAAEVYTEADRTEQPTLAQMTEAALKVLKTSPEQTFALFVEAGDVDFALHGNNLDNAIGAVYSGEDAVRTVIRWVETFSNWDESVLIVSADHGHYLVIDDPTALAASVRGTSPKR